MNSNYQPCLRNYLKQIKNTFSQRPHSKDTVNQNLVRNTKKYADSHNNSTNNNSKNKKQSVKCKGVKYRKAGEKKMKIVLRTNGNMEQQYYSDYQMDSDNNRLKKNEKANNGWKNKNYLSMNNQYENMTSTNYNSGQNEKQMIDELRNQNQYLQKQIDQINATNMSYHQNNHTEQQIIYDTNSRSKQIEFNTTRMHNQFQTVNRTKKSQIDLQGKRQNRNRYQDQMDQITKQSLEIQHYQHQMQEYQHQMQEYQHQMQEQQLRIEEMDKEKCRMKEQSEKKEDEIVRLNIRVQELEGRVDIDKKSKNEESQKYERLEETIDRVKQMIGDGQDIVGTLQQMQQENVIQKNKIKYLECQIDMEQQQKKRVLEKKDMELERVNKQIIVLENRVKQKDIEIQQRLQKEDEWVLKIKRMVQNSVGDIEVSSDCIDGVVGSLQAAIQQLNGNNDELMQDNDKNILQIKYHQQQIKQLDKQVKYMNEQNQQLSKKVGKQSRQGCDGLQEQINVELKVCQKIVNMLVTYLDEDCKTVLQKYLDINGQIIQLISQRSSNQLQIKVDKLKDQKMYLEHRLQTGLQKFYSKVNKLETKINLDMKQNKNIRIKVEDGDGDSMSYSWSKKMKKQKQNDKGVSFFEDESVSYRQSGVMNLDDLQNSTEYVL